LALHRAHSDAEGRRELHDLDLVSNCTCSTRKYFAQCPAAGCTAGPRLEIDRSECYRLVLCLNELMITTAACRWRRASLARRGTRRTVRAQKLRRNSPRRATLPPTPLVSVGPSAVQTQAYIGVLDHVFRRKPRVAAAKHASYAPGRWRAAEPACCEEPAAIAALVCPVSAPLQRWNSHKLVSCDDVVWC